MSFSTCYNTFFQCQENIDRKYLDTKKSLDAIKAEISSLNLKIVSKTSEIALIDTQLNANEHYHFMYKDLPDLHDVGAKRTDTIEGIILTQFGERTTQYVTTDPKRVEFNASGLHNYRISKETFMLLLNKFPLKIYEKTTGHTDNSALRFFSEINVSDYWNVEIFLVKTKTRWLVGFVPKDETKIYFCDVAKKELFVPDPSKPEDNPEVILI
jgi:hypothetical protein